MKTTKWISLCLLLLTVAMLFSACGQSTVGFKKALDGDKFSPAALHTSGNKVTALQHANFSNSSGPLLRFTKTGDNDHREYIVYNIETDTVVLSRISTTTKPVGVALAPTDYGTFISVSSSSEEHGPHRAIYSETGTLIAEADTSVISVQCDLICLDDKVYRVQEDGTAAYAFDWSSLAKFPTLQTRLGDFYMTWNHEKQTILFYDSELNIVSTYVIPPYARKFSSVGLSSDKILLQYAIVEPDDAKDYTYINMGSKYTLKTFLYMPKKDKLKEVKLDAVITSTLARVEDQEKWDEMALSNQYDAMLTTYPIVDKQLPISDAATQLYLVAKNGKISAFEIEELENDTPHSWKQVATDLFEVTTSNSRYLINEKGKIVADISNAGIFAGYLGGPPEDDGKLYNLNAELVLDYMAAGLRWKGWFANCILFENKDGELICFANGTLTTLVAKDSQRTFFMASGHLVITDRSTAGSMRHEFYGANGEKILEVTEAGNDALFGFAGSGENGEILISCQRANGSIDYYRLVS